MNYRHRKTGREQYEFPYCLTPEGFDHGAVMRGECSIETRRAALGRSGAVSASRLWPVELSDYDPRFRAWRLANRSRFLGFAGTERLLRARLGRGAYRAFGARGVGIAWGSM